MSYIYCALWLFSANIYQENERREILKRFAWTFEYDAITGQSFCEVYCRANDVAVARILFAFADVFKGKMIHEYEFNRICGKYTRCTERVQLPIPHGSSPGPAGKCNIVNITEYA
jgi:hypothetical protein